MQEERLPERGWLVDALLAWYRQHGRRLPWRQCPSPYEVLVSEVMLHQTRVETVLAYYPRFLRRFPDFVHLANASEEEVLAVWEGLGYYRRALNLHRAAKLVLERHGGRLPTAEEELRRLPGVGAYTAAALQAFAFRRPAAPVDANVRRIFRRFAPTVSVAALVEELLAEEPFDVGQALLDLGALVCRPRRPLCDRCPWQSRCATRGEGEKVARPPKRAEEDVVVAVLHDAGRIVIGRRKAGMYRGMYGLPLWPEDPLVAAYLDGVSLGGFRHVFTHRVWHVRVVAARYERPTPPDGYTWCAVDRLAQLPLGGVFRQALELFFGLSGMTRIP